MGQTLEGADAVHRMKRGRPAKKDTPEVAALLSHIDVLAVAKADTVQAIVEATVLSTPEQIDARREQIMADRLAARLQGRLDGYTPLTKDELASAAYHQMQADERAQTYAMRVWSGQSVDVPPAERKERVFNALHGQNLSTDGIIFP